MKYKGTYPSVYKVTDYGQKIGDEANRLAYPGNPKEAQYPSGRPTPQYKAAKDKVLKGYVFWSKPSKAGASCDVFAATCIRSAYDHNIPAGLWKMQRYMESHADYIKVTATEDTLQDGDIIIYRKSPSVPKKGHICIYYKGKIKEASAGYFYGRTTDKVQNRLSLKGKKYVYVFRVKDKKTYSPLRKGSSGTEVKRLQKYLNWYFASDDELKALKIDGDFGPLTTGRVKLMQNQLGLKIDGVVGRITLEKMKGVTR